MVELGRVVAEHQDDILDEWLRGEVTTPHFRPDLLSDEEVRTAGRSFLEAFAGAWAEGEGALLEGEQWRPLRQRVEALAESRGAEGFSVTEVARFVFSFKEPLFSQLQPLGLDVPGLARERSKISRILDELGLHAVEVDQQAREQVIRRQQQAILELSTPVIDLWEGVLLAPLIGTLDSQRTQAVMETLLRRVVETRSHVVVLDITGVPTVDTMVAQHLLKTIAAARLMGAECIISGIRPAIAQTIVHLGVDLSAVITKATMADAFAEALARAKRRPPPEPPAPEELPEAPSRELH